MINKIQVKLLEVQFSDNKSHKLLRNAFAGVAVALVAVGAAHLGTLDVPTSNF